MIMTMIIVMMFVILMKTRMRLGQCQPVGEAGTPWAEIVAGTHSRVQAYQTASSEAQTLQPINSYLC